MYMKKIFWILSVAMLTLTACSSISTATSSR